MAIEYLLKGIIVGLSASIPLGPIGVLCIQRTIMKGKKAGFVSGLGAATADGVFAILAGFGVSVVIDSLIEYQDALKIIGAVVLAIMGAKLVTTNPAKQVRQPKKKNKKLWGDFASFFALTISNPMYLFVFIAVFAGFGLVGTESNTASVLLLIAGILAGASLWWFTLTSIVSMFRSKFRLRRILYLNRITGVVIIFFGIFVFISVFLNA